jgi:hypothetical protein
MAAALIETGAASDPAVVEAAQQLMALLDAAGTQSGKYLVELRGVQGVQVGDHNTQTNTLRNADERASVGGRGLEDTSGRCRHRGRRSCSQVEDVRRS